MDSQNLPEKSQSLAPLNLNPPLLQGWKTPVVGYDGGLGVSAVLGGLNFVIDPWLNMDADDEVKVYAGNATAPVWSKTIKPDEKDQRVRGTIEPGYILRGDLYPLFYTVKRISQQVPEESTPRQRLLVKLDRPGGFDDDYAEEGHSHLRYSIPQTIIDNGVGPGEAKAGVPITIPAYPFMRRHDQVIYVWGHIRKSIKVSPDQAEKPDDHPLIITIDEETIVLVGDGNKIPFYYQVVDEVGNYPDERSPWSATTYLTVDLKQQRLDAPIIIEADPVSDVIDLEDLGENNVTALVNTGGLKVDDIIALTWTGTPAEGPQVIHGPIELPVVRVGIAVTFDIPNAKVKAIAKGRALVSYVLNPATDKKQSLNASVKVEGDISRLLPPNILEAAGGHLPVDSKPATVSVPYYVGRNTGDLISVHCEGKRAEGGSTYYPIRIIVSDEPEGIAIERSVPASEIAPLDGGTLKVYYTVANDDVVLNSVRESLPLDLSVGQAQADMPKPDVTQADDNDVLLPENAPTGADIIAPFTETLDKDIVGLRWIGSISGAHPTYEIPLNTHTAGHPVPFNVKPSYISANRNGTVDVSYYLIRAQVPTRGSLVRTLSIGVAKPKWNAPKVLQAPDGQLDPNTHQNGFTVQVDTTGMADGDGIDLIVDGRPGEGSTRPERRYVSGQVPIDFTIAALITGANIGREVSIGYEVVKGTGPQPSETLTLQIGELLERNLPKPLLEGFEGDVINLNNIKDTTEVRCSKWPFQLSGGPVWLSYTELREDGTSRTEDQLKGEPHNQNDGLALVAPVQWFRECREGSTATIGLKTGLFRASTAADAVFFPAREYTAERLLDDLTTFEGGDLNGWSTIPGSYIKILQANGNTFIEGNTNIEIIKNYKNFSSHRKFELTFDYYLTTPAHLAIVYFGKVGVTTLSNLYTWTSYKLEYEFTPTSTTVEIYLSNSSPKMDNIRIRQST